VTITEKYDRIAQGFSEHDYADPEGYSARRARLIVELGPRLEPAQSVLDLCCADGIMAAPLAAYGLRYRGVDLSEGMIEAARVRNPGVPFVVGRCEDYEPPEPVDATICLRSFYQPADRVAFFRHVAGYTQGKFVFDFRPRAHAAGPVLRDLRLAGFSAIELRPFFLPQRRRLPHAGLPLVDALERAGPPAMLAARLYGRLFCVAQV
jgi:SAM-dependent methyltransferase